jgi:dihydrofolate reductase
MKATIYMGMSLDGFVARPDDALDFLSALPEGGGEFGDDGSFAKFLATVDVLVMGRRTFEVVLPFDPWPYGETPVAVLSRTLTTLPSGTPPTVRVMAGEPAEVLQRLEAEGVRHAYVDGAVTARAFLAAGLITDLVITHVPVLIGAGISPWGPLPADVRLKLVSTGRYRDQAVKSHYTVQAAKAAGRA